jgi:hypothetical protein
MPKFTVSWSIDVDAETSEEALLNAIVELRHEHSMATVFDVKDPEGKTTRHDTLALLPVLVTEDGYTFYRQSDGSYTDHIDPERVDMRFDNLDQLREAVSLGCVNPIKSFINPADFAPSIQSKPKVAIIIEGGLVEAVISDQPHRLPFNIRVIDIYHGCKEDDFTFIKRDDGSQYKTQIYQVHPELPEIDLDAVFDEDLDTENIDITVNIDS